MKTHQKNKRDGFYMAIIPEERKMIDRLQEQAINVSQAFKLFLKQMLERIEKHE